MRLLNTLTLELEEFDEPQIPEYAILSHRWGSVDQEVSCNDYQAGRKKKTSGHDKIVRFCVFAREQGFAYGWVDTCCIDKSSSAELSEAINSMFHWYQDATACYAYLWDVSGLHDLSRSEWFSRGWTLQELVAPHTVVFLDCSWRPLGSKVELRHIVAQPSGVDEDFLTGSVALGDYSVAQRMSWASHRKTSRIEDEAYCLMGLFGVNMPLLYGERRESFRRLQEVIMAQSEDNSLFVWGLGLNEDNRGTGTIDSERFRSALAPSPQYFSQSQMVQKGFASQRILFELTNRGMMVLIHRSYNPEVLEDLLHNAADHLNEEDDLALGLTLPLGCFTHSGNNGSNPCRGHRALEPCSCPHFKSYVMRLVLDCGKWRRVGVTCHVDQDSWADYQGKHYFAYANDYVRIYIHHDRDGASDVANHHVKDCVDLASRPVSWLHLQDDTDYAGFAG